MERDKLLGTMDAKVWTDEFVATKDRLGDEEFDHAMMLAWFANAIMAGFDEANRRAQRALDAERARVKELQGAASTPINELLAELISCAGVFDVSTDYEDDRKALETATQAVLDHVATLQAQLRQVEGERDHAKKMEAVQKEVADNQTWHVQKLKGWRDTVTLALQRPGGARFEDVPGHIKALVKEHDTLRQLVEALPVVDGRMDVECGACYYIRSFVAEQYGVVCGLITEQATAMAIKTLLEYRATLAAQDPPHPTEEQS